MSRPAAGEQAWPAFLVIGAPKAGTTSVQTYLRQHPELDVALDPDVDPLHAEPGYFSHVLDAVEAGERDADEAREWYQDLVADLDGRPGDVTPSYLAHPKAAERIHEANPDARLVCLLRDPVERAWSHYRMNVGRGGLDQPFDQALDEDLAAERSRPLDSTYVRPGRYVDHLERYRERFDDDQLLILFTEQMGADTDAVLRRIVSFVGADPDRVERVDTDERHNPNLVPANRLAEKLRSSDLVERLARLVVPRAVRDFVDQRVLMRPGPKPAMPEDQRERLVEVFRDDVHALAEMLDRPLPWDAERWDLAPEQTVDPANLEP